MALNDDGEVFSWGRNTFGQLGPGNTTNSNIPVKIDIPPTVSISCGAEFRIALDIEGNVWCWGRDVNYLVKGANSTLPVQILGLNNITTVAAGYVNCLALDNENNVWYWNFQTQTQPSIVLNNAIAIAISGITPAALTLDGDLIVWQNILNTVLPGVLDIINPRIIFNNIIRLHIGFLGDLHVIDNDNNLIRMEKVGTDMRKIDIQSVGKVIAVSTGYHHYVVQTINKTLLTWGTNRNGKLGNGTYNYNDIPQQMEYRLANTFINVKNVKNARSRQM